MNSERDAITEKMPDLVPNIYRFDMDESSRIGWACSITYMKYPPTFEEWKAYYYLIKYHRSHIDLVCEMTDVGNYGWACDNSGNIIYRNHNDNIAHTFADVIKFRNSMMAQPRIK